MNPLWNDVLVAGMGGEDGTEPFLGSVDKIGTAYTDDTLATGFGSYLALPIMRERWRPDLKEGEGPAPSSRTASAYCSTGTAAPTTGCRSPR